MNDWETAKQIFDEAKAKLLGVVGTRPGEIFDAMRKDCMQVRPAGERNSMVLPPPGQVFSPDHWPAEGPRVNRLLKKCRDAFIKLIHTYKALRPEERAQVNELENLTPVELDILKKSIASPARPPRA
jgi:hypothetical protein